MTFDRLGSIKNIRMGRCVCAPGVKDLLSVSALAKKGHECVLNENNPRMICKDGTIVPMYFFNNLFYMPYVTPATEYTAANSATRPLYTVGESRLLSSCIAANNLESNEPEEAVVRLDARPAQSRTIKIDPEMSDNTVASTDDDHSAIAHHILGHVGHRKVRATSAVVDGMPKYSKNKIWCTSCHKGKMTHLPHAHDLWRERAEHAHDAWHIDLIGKFANPSLGGNFTRAYD